MRVSVIQSNYIPWKGYFDLINSSDIFIIYDEVQYTKNDWRNRNKIKTRHGIKWLTIDVNHSMNQKISEISVSNPNWRIKHWKTICQNYSKVKYFNDYKAIFNELYLGSNEKNLSYINQVFIKKIIDILGIKTKILNSKDFELKEGKQERLIDLLKKVNATTYISGPSAKEYINENLFYQENIQLEWMEYSEYKEYKQLYPPFNHNVSIIDLIFNEGPYSKKFMKSFTNE